ncbi:unnamed protein product [Protopolystoma xenopodis]|uniref:Uncharacterized protein n=1 Tax=Protopolystoma xenopodis TaxID=117903 RepID=A0A3S5B0N7_9PLAT|nr:unnamed protein product [Protopolystoma xenopodis]
MPIMLFLVNPPGIAVLDKNMSLLTQGTLSNLFSERHTGQGSLTRPQSSVLPKALDLFELGLQDLKPDVHDGMMTIDPWPAHTSSRFRGTTQVAMPKNNRLLFQPEKQSKQQPAYKPKFLEILESKIAKDKTRYHVDDTSPSPLKLQPPHKLLGQTI